MQAVIFDMDGVIVDSEPFWRRVEAACFDELGADIWNPEREIDEAERAQLSAGHGVVAEVDEHYIPLRNLSNNYQIDRANQKTVTFSGVRGVAEQDAMIQESQGRISDRTREHLTSTDTAIVRFRRTVLGLAKALADGQEPEAPWHHKAYRLRSGSWMAQRSVPFDDVMRTRFGDPVGRVVPAPENAG